MTPDFHFQTEPLKSGFPLVLEILEKWCWSSKFQKIWKNPGILFHILVTFLAVDLVLRWLLILYGAASKNLCCLFNNFYFVNYPGILLLTLEKSWNFVITLEWEPWKCNWRMFTNLCLTGINSTLSARKSGKRIFSQEEVSFSTQYSKSTQPRKLGQVRNKWKRSANDFVCWRLGLPSEMVTCTLIEIGLCLFLVCQ